MNAVVLRGLLCGIRVPVSFLLLTGCDQGPLAQSLNEPAKEPAPPAAVSASAGKAQGGSSLGTGLPAPEAAAFMPKDSVVQALVRKFFDGNAEVQTSVVDELLHIGTVEALEGLLHLSLSLPPGELKSHLCQGLAGMETREKRDYLLGALPSADPDARRALVQAVGAQADSEFVLAVVDRCDNSEDPQVRNAMLQSLSSVTSPGATETLAAVVDDPLNGVGDEIVWAAAQSLSRTGSPPAVNSLLRKLNGATSPKETERLSDLVAGINHPSAASALRYAALGNKDASSSNARLAAVRSLENFPSAENLEALRTLQSDPDPRIQKAAREISLGMQGVLGQ